MTYRSASTIRADVARRVYDATGRGIVVAVIDSGVDANHIHFQRHRNLDLPEGLSHIDLTSDDNKPESAPTDAHGHGTHIAGIIAGEATGVRAAEKSWRADGDFEYFVVDVPHIAGIAPECRILSLKVLDQEGNGTVSTLIRALERIQQFNEGRLRIPIVDIGLGYDFDAERFACGRSPVCVAVERLVRSGVVVVTSTGNTGYGSQRALQRTTQQGMEVSINDPGNAELAITVGSTNRELPQVYGVSYFSSKGPTLDGRMKPDVVAPGELIVSCGAGRMLLDVRERGGVGEDVMYRADSGTSLATAHVAGAAAALLSARRELIGQPEAVKAVLMNSAVDLRRSPFYQGHGLIDLLQAMEQNVLSPRLTPEMGIAVTPYRARAAEPAPAMPFTMRPTPADTLPRVVRVMYSYSHKDDVFREELHMALAALRREGLIDIWQDRKILPGSEFDRDIARALAESDVVLLLVSRQFIASDYSWSKEMTEAVRRHNEGTCVVVPIILKPADWKTSPFGKLTALPRDGKPITEWENQDAAWADVAEGIRRLVTSKRASHL